MFAVAIKWLLRGRAHISLVIFPLYVFNLSCVLVSEFIEFNSITFTAIYIRQGEKEREARASKSARDWSSGRVSNFESLARERLLHNYGLSWESWSRENSRTLLCIFREINSVATANWDNFLKRTNLRLGMLFPLWRRHAIRPSDKILQRTHSRSPVRFTSNNDGSRTVRGTPGEIFYS